MLLRPELMGVPPVRRYHFSSYWRTWSRVLLVKHREFQTVELNLTPINGNWSQDVLPVIIRVHSTQPSPRDLSTPRLPIDVWKLLGERLGRDFRHHLCTTDFVPMIDWSKQELNRGGGCPIALIAKVPA